LWARLSAKVRKVTRGGGFHSDEPNRQVGRESGGTRRQRNFERVLKQGNKSGVGPKPGNGTCVESHETSSRWVQGRWGIRGSSLTELLKTGTRRTPVRGECEVRGHGKQGKYLFGPKDIWGPFVLEVGFGVEVV